MKIYSAAIILLCASLPARAEDKKPLKKYATYVGVVLKKNFIYNSSRMENTGNAYTISSWVQPLIYAEERRNISDRLSVSMGLSYCSSGYYVNYSYHAATTSLFESLGVGVGTIALPVLLHCDFGNRFSVAAGPALNYNIHNQATIAGGSVAIDSIIARATTYGSSPPVSYFTVSAQASVSYQLFKKTFVSLLFDWDMGKYPHAVFTNWIDNQQTGQTTAYTFSGAPRFYYVGIGVCRRLWQKVHLPKQINSNPTPEEIRNNSTHS